MGEADNQEESESAHDVAIKAVLTRSRCASRPMPKRSEKRVTGLELEPERDRARPRVFWAVEEL